MDGSEEKNNQILCVKESYFYQKVLREFLYSFRYCKSITVKVWN